MKNPVKKIKIYTKIKQRNSFQKEFEQQISLLEWFLKAGEMAAVNLALPSQK